MQRVKKAKKSKAHRPPKSPMERWQYVKLTNQLNLALVVRNLHDEYGWTKEQIDEFIGGYIGLMVECYDGRSTVNDMIRQTTELTGIDVRGLIDEVMEDR